MQIHELAVGRNYTVDAEGRHPGVWELIKINSVNVKLQHTQTKARLNAHPSFLAEVDPDNAPVLSLMALPLVAGTVVEFKGKLNVVVSVTGLKHKLVTLGGHGGGWRNVGRSQLTEIPLEELAAKLV